MSDSSLHSSRVLICGFSLRICMASFSLKITGSFSVVMISTVTFNMSMLSGWQALRWLNKDEVFLVKCSLVRSWRCLIVLHMYRFRQRLHMILYTTFFRKQILWRDVLQLSREQFGCLSSFLRSTCFSDVDLWTIRTGNPSFLKTLVSLRSCNSVADIGYTQVQTLVMVSCRWNVSLLLLLLLCGFRCYTLNEASRVSVER
jgi:hypothetical protein